MIPLLRVLQGVESGWVWLYTAGLPAESASRRREELASDAWEHVRYSEVSPLALIWQALYRFLFGVPNDASWRIGLGRRGFARSEWWELTIAFLLVGGLTIAMPAGLFLALFSAPGFDGPDGPSLVLSGYLLAIVVLFGGVAVMVIERSPVAGGVLGAIGSICSATAAWNVWPVVALAVAAGSLSVVVAIVQTAARSSRATS